MKMHKAVSCKTKQNKKKISNNKFEEGIFKRVIFFSRKVFLDMFKALQRDR